MFFINNKNIYNYFIALFICIICASLCSCNHTVGDVDVLGENGTVSLGIYYSGVEITGSFVLKNNKNVDIKIIDVKSTCSCSVVGKYSGRVIQSGTHGEFNFVINTLKMPSGNKTEILGVEYIHNGINETKEINVNYVVIDPIEIHPSSLTRLNAQNNTVDFNVNVSNNSFGDIYTLVSVETESGILLCKLSKDVPIKILDSEEFNLSLINNEKSLQSINDVVLYKFQDADGIPFLKTMPVYILWQEQT